MEKYKNSKFIFVVGIGGSDLASKAVWNAMTLHKPEVDKKLFFLESPDTREYEEIESIVKNEINDLSEIVLIAISKSGQTVETLETFKKIFDILYQKFDELIKNQTLIITTKNSPLWQIAEEKEIEKKEWPARQAGIAGGEGEVGGRFSAFTIAHTTVLSIAGLNIEDFIEGSHSAEASRDEQEKLAQNIFDNYKQGLNILDFFIFNSELEDLGKWCRQLIAESLSLITPTVSIGPTDLHSMLELYLGGPKNRFTVFIESKNEIEGSISAVAYKNVSEAYDKAGLPFMKYEMDKITERELGIFMAFMINVTLELAKLLEINPYDQPAVEEYKKNISKSQ
ncbi:MAG: hypothetical protein WC657_01440 [Candidatus Paceibacterota bacterium]|jgi:glucose-6-phosphate isomerase